MINILIAIFSLIASCTISTYDFNIKDYSLCYEKDILPNVNSGDTFYIGDFYNGFFDKNSNELISSGCMLDDVSNIYGGNIFMITDYFDNIFPYYGVNLGYALKNDFFNSDYTFSSVLRKSSSLSPNAPFNDYFQQGTLKKYRSGERFFLENAYVLHNFDDNDFTLDISYASCGISNSAINIIDYDVSTKQLKNLQIDVNGWDFGNLLYNLKSNHLLLIGTMQGFSELSYRSISVYDTNLIDNDTYIDNIRNESYDEGYYEGTNEGYNQGVNDAFNSMNGQWSIFKNCTFSLTDLENIGLPNLSNLQFIQYVTPLNGGFKFLVPSPYMESLITIDLATPVQLSFYSQMFTSNFSNAYCNLIFYFDDNTSCNIFPYDNENDSYYTIDIPIEYKDKYLTKIEYIFMSREYASFDLFINSEYYKGYDIGYNQGSNDGYDYGYDKGNTDGYNSGYDSGYYKGKNDGIEMSGDINSLPKSFINALFSVPINMVKSLLNFEFFGINLFSFCTSLITLSLILWLIRKFMGGK